MLVKPYTAVSGWARCRFRPEFLHGRGFRACAVPYGSKKRCSAFQLLLGFTFFALMATVTMTSEPVLSQERASTADNNSDINGVLIAGFLAITGTVVGGVVKGYWDTKLSEKDFQARLILRALEADDVHVRTSSLKFLVTTNLISSRKIRQGINELIKEGRDSIPKFGSSVNITSQFEPLSFILEKDEVGVYTIGYNHQLTSQELRDGYIIIDGQPTNFKDGITEQQAQKLLNQDLEPARKAVDKLVEVGAYFKAGSLTGKRF